MKSYYIIYSIKGRFRSIVLEARDFAGAEQEFKEQVGAWDIVQISIFS